jgi:hypothetical protein
VQAHRRIIDRVAEYGLRERNFGSRQWTP